jgi:3-isopropylmalate/(R)-2-methylmalate dehydratase small subunit
MPLNRSDVDTDSIMPAKYLKRLERTGFGEFAFEEWRKDPSFVMNEPRYKGSTVLVTGPNFGCGSSREHAPWGVQDMGFKVVIAPSFADIFRSNAIGNGLLPVAIGDAAVNTIFDRAEAGNGYAVTVDLQRREVRDESGLRETFAIDEASRQRLLEGQDEIDLILHHESDIAAFERGL